MLFNAISKRSITEQQLKKTCRACACEPFKSHNRTELQNYVAYQDKLHWKKEATWGLLDF